MQATIAFLGSVACSVTQRRSLDIIGRTVRSSQTRGRLTRCPLEDPTDHALSAPAGRDTLERESETVASGCLPRAFLPPRGKQEERIAIECLHPHTIDRIVLRSSVLTDSLAWTISPAVSVIVVGEQSSTSLSSSISIRPPPPTTTSTVVLHISLPHRPTFLYGTTLTRRRLDVFLK